MLGKLIGLLIGSAFGIPGLILGLVFGHVADVIMSPDRSNSFSMNPELDDEGLVGGLFRLFGAFAGASGGPTRQQALYLQQVTARVMGLGPWDARTASEAFQAAVLEKPRPSQVAESLSSQFILDRTTTFWVWTVCKELIRYGHSSEQVWSELEAVAFAFGFTVRRRTGFSAGPRPSHVHQDDYALLGVGRDAGPEAIKAAFRRLARETHPDTLSELPPESPERKRRTERFLAIQAAYERVRAHRGF